ncbi:MAG: MBL fold metallo-hydrolase [Bdellovibrionales bacterium]|nr:MBL fold metallo-hydrolase [Bdellovibrionales bacterium]
MNKITILGSGTSTGVPILGCKCAVCQSIDPRNKRLRTSALLETEQNKTILVDASPDLRTQLLQTQTMKLDAVIITHDHADHTHGLDDVRPYTFNRPAPMMVHTDAHTAKSLTKKFSYIFDRQNKPIIGGGIPLLELATLAVGEQKIADETFEIFSLPHGYGDTLGFRHQKLGYLIDCREVPQNVLDIFRDAKLEILIIDCLRYLPHQTHLHFDLTLNYIQQIQPKLALLTHMSHEMEYLDLTNQLQRRGIRNVFPAIDGQSFLYS